ncbi:hypothetical protein AAG906_021696 [Vitis piasezkii]
MEKFSILGFLFVILCLITRDLACKGETLEGNCLKADREALLDFKNGLKDSSNNRLSSWIGGNCCQWEGIGCENNTGVVISIDLHNPYYLEEAYENWSSMNLSGEIRPSLIELKSLRSLDLSGNSFEHIPIPKFFGSLKNLQYLNLSNCGFRGAIPPTLGNLSNLQFLDLSSIESQLFVKDLEWMTNLVSLRHLKLNYVNLSMLHLEDCGLSGSISSLNSINFTSLSVISIGGNYFRSKFPIWLLNLSSLVYIDLSSSQLYGQISPGLGELPNLQYLDLSGNNNLTGTIPESLSQLEKLTHLDLSCNKLQGPIPASFGTFKNLNEMWLGSNELNGSLPVSFGQLSELVKLDVSWNRLTGILSEEHFSKLSKLKFLWMNANSGLVLNVSSTWVAPFQITDLSMASCNLGPSFPTWPRSQKEVSLLDLSNASISDTIPEWLSQLEKLTHLDLSHNKLQGPIPASFGTLKNLNEMWLGQNELNGSLPVSFGQLSELVKLEVAGTRVTGIISEEHFSKLRKLKMLWIDRNSGLVLNVSSTWVPPFQITYLSMASCNLGSSFPTWLRSQKEVSFLDLSNAILLESLQGRLPNSLKFSFGNSIYIDFDYNLFEGPIHFSNNRTIPFHRTHHLSSSNCSSLIVLDLGNNNLSGMLPKSLGQLQWLESLHLNDNKLSGELLSSFQNLSRLQLLDLSYNQLSGKVPSWIGTAFINLTSLHVLDLAQNNLMGEIPVTLVELKAMVPEYNKNIYPLYHNVSNSWYEERLVVIMKGQSLEYSRTLSLVVGIDLSDNNLSGELPQEITKLFGLVVLNLSGNHISGQIPESISMLHQLLSLDFMVSLTFLSYLNLSNNNFSAPLVTKCHDEDLDKKYSAIEDKNDGGYIDQWFYLSVGLGFAMGILVPYFVLPIRKSWCESYFDFVDKIVKWLLRGRTTYAKDHLRR